ncbi:unnamed protein product [Cuscuta campestris]|uniref:Uncharacterized protein n=1 Tax=Cuscuta campestris TaxID=132261 RepID=A0A484NTH7_9ASTE|nr:unnamed protein product [Cuscuta campestris]
MKLLQNLNFSCPTVGRYGATATLYFPSSPTGTCDHKDLKAAKLNPKVAAKLRHVLILRNLSNMHDFSIFLF